jgi:hypothetical protein
MGTTAMTSEFDMGAGQVAKEVRRGVPSVFCAASKNIHSCGRAAASVGIIDREEGYVD